MHDCSLGTSPAIPRKLKSYYTKVLRCAHLYIDAAVEDASVLLQIVFSTRTSLVCGVRVIGTPAFTSISTLLVSSFFHPEPSRHAAQPDRARNRDAFALGESVLSELGHEVIVAHARNVRSIVESRRKDDRFDAEPWPGWQESARICWGLPPRSRKAQAELTLISARAGPVNTAED